jgi:hypothetical protein
VGSPLRRVDARPDAPDRFRGVGPVALEVAVGRVLRAAVVLVVVAGCAGCSGGGLAGGGHDGFMDQDEYREALAAAVGDYRWPPGYEPDAAKVVDDGASDDALMEDGYEQMVLGILNECAWNLAWLDARASGDAAAEREALDVLTTVIPNQPGRSPDARQWAEDAAAKAALGDPSMVQARVTAGCEPVYWTTGA